MTVKELIDKLKNLPQDLEVVMDDYDFPEGWMFSYVSPPWIGSLGTDSDSKYKGQDTECVILEADGFFPSPGLKE